MSVTRGSVNLRELLLRIDEHQGPNPAMEATASSLAIHFGDGYNDSHAGNALSRSLQLIALSLGLHVAPI